MSKLGDAVKTAQQVSIDLAYLDYLAAKPEAESNLLNTLLDFAKRKITRSLFDCPEGSDTVDDAASEVAFTIWQQLSTFKGGPGDFYYWVDRICYTKGARAFRENTADFKGRVPLQMKSEDGDMYDNPELRREPERPVPSRKLPGWIQGIDLHICRMIRDDQEYGEIARVLEMTEQAVKNRIARMKKRIQAEKMEKNNVTS